VNVGQIVSFRPLSFSGALTIKTNSVFYEDTSIAGNTTVLSSGTVLTFARKLNWISGTIWPAVTGTGSNIELSPGATMNVGSTAGSLGIGVTINNGAVLNVNRVGLVFQNFGTLSFPVLNNTAGGTINFNSGGTLDSTDPYGGAVINQGTLTCNGLTTTFPSKIYFYNTGTVATYGVDCVIDGPAFLPPGNGPILTGAYEMYNGRIMCPADRYPSGVNSGVRLMFQGGGAAFSNFSSVWFNDGVIHIKPGAYVTVGLNGNNLFVNRGVVEVNPGSQLVSMGSAEATTSAILDLHIAGPTDAGYGRYNSMLAWIGGPATALVTPIEGYQPQIGDRMPVIIKTLNGVSGAVPNFGKVLDTGLPANARARFVSSGTSIDLAIVCRSDLDADGTVDLSDFFVFFNCWDLSEPCADVSNDGEVDLVDFFSFFDGFDLGC